MARDAMAYHVGAMTITVRLFGPEARLVGAGSVDLDLADATPSVANVRAALVAAYPALAGHLQRVRLAVNHEFADDATPVNENDEVALIGQVSGG